MANDKQPPTYRFTGVTMQGVIRSHEMTLDEATEKYSSTGTNPVVTMAKEWLAAIDSGSYKTVAVSFDIGDGK